MLSPSSPAQKALGEEDCSSGSDAGSEVILEPETDRFGFIVTNGSTAGSVGPAPELVRQREAKWINLIGQWDRMLMKKTSKIKVQCQKGIPASLRAKCWPLLCGATDRMKQSEKLYQSLDSQPALQSWVDVIERDLDRQFPFHEMFLSKDGHGQRGLFRVLKAYTQYQPEEGYCQAQGPVAAVLLMNMPAEEAFWCLVQISEQYLPGYYSPLLEGVLFDAAMLTWVLKRTCPAAHKHLQHHGVEPLMFATDWLMCLFTRHLPFNTLLRVWDLFFCYGVRVLLQVAVVLVRRVLGRADQRKQCQGQMETLERLRGVREQVQDDDDAFIAEVCAVPLSAKDLEKHTEKELEKWRKDRPSSKFDPRGRCHGYRMAWARNRQHEEERDRKERETGNLSLPLARSSSTLSLSPSMLHRWRKGGKANAGDWEGGGSGGRVVRHLSMGAKEDLRSWTEINFKKVQDVEEEEDVVSEEYKKLSGHAEQEEPTEMSTKQVEETVTVKEEVEQAETTQLEMTEESQVILEQTEETNEETESTESQAQDQASENIPQQEEELESHDCEQPCHEVADQETQAEDTNTETEHQEEESEHTAAVEENVTDIQTDDDTNTEVETEEGVDTSEEQIIQADMKPEESIETENVQQVDTITEVSATTTESPASETDGEVKAQTVTDPIIEPETHPQGQEVITETESSSQGDACEGKYHSIESLAETDMKEEEPHTRTETETDVLAQNQEKVETETDSEQHVDSQIEAETFVTCSPERIEEAAAAADAETEAEAPASDDAGEALSEPQNSEEERDAVASEPTQEIERLIAQPEEDNDHTQAEEAPTETTDSVAPPQRELTSAQGEDLTDSVAPPQTELTSAQGEDLTDSVAPPQTELTSAQGEDLTDSVAPPQTELTSAQGEDLTDSVAPPQTELTSAQGEDLTDSVAPPQTELTSAQGEDLTDSVAPPQTELTSAQGEDLTTEPGGSSGDISTNEEPAPEQANIRATAGAAEEVEHTENAQENTGDDDVFISNETTDSKNTDSDSQVQDKESLPVKDQTELNNMQVSGRRSSRSSADFCIRKSSSSQGSRLGRRLSEDLFTMPQKASQTQSIPDQSDVKPPESQPDPGVVEPTNQAPPSEVVSSPSERATESTAPQQQEPPKRFGLFRRLRGGEQPKKTKMQVPKILIQDFSDVTETAEQVEAEEKLSSRERRRRRRERERREKEEERVRKKKEKELEKERKKPQTRGKSFQAQKEKGSSEEAQSAKTGSQTLRYSASCSETYF